MQRVDWVDVAKGLAISLVVIYHANLLLGQNGLGLAVWDDINAVFVTVRMPLFFMASGIFAGSVIARPWRGLWSSRLALLVWTFLVWTVLRFAYFSLVPMAARPEETSVLRLLAAPLLPSGGLWFLHALVAFFVVSKLMRGRMSPAWQLGVAAVLSAAFLSVLTVKNLSYDGMARYFLFFLLGLHLKDWILRQTDAPRPGATLLALLVFGVAQWGVSTFALQDVPGVLTVLGGLSLVASVLLARVLAATPLVGGLTFLGRNTLPVYVAHVIVLAALVTALTHWPGAAEFLPVLPVVLAAITIGLTLVLHSLAERTPARHLYEAPAPVRLAPPAPARVVVGRGAGAAVLPEPPSGRD